MIFVGVDPGLTGAIAFVGDDMLEPSVHDLPTVPLLGEGLITKRIDGAGLQRIIAAHIPPGALVVVAVELVGAMGGQGKGKDNAVQIPVSLGRTLGAIEATFECMGWRPVVLAPQRWKGLYGLGSDKRASLDLARKLFPSLAFELKRQKDDNRAEALLIANYARKVMKP